MQSRGGLGSALYKSRLRLVASRSSCCRCDSRISFGLRNKKNIAEEFNINNLADIAIWADKVRRNRKHKNPWHYTNVKEGEWTYVISRDCPKGNCVVEKIKEFSSVLTNVELPLKRRKVALKYLVHFLGDVHQPLHLGNLKNLGGGKICHTYLGKNVTLNYLSDGGLIDWKKGSLFKYAAHLNAQA
jgi:nuclease S1